MTRTLHINDETDTYRPSQGVYGFTISDDKHMAYRSALRVAHLKFGVLSAVRKDTMTPWLQVTVVETTFDKNGRAQPKQICTVLEREEMIALRDVLNATLGE